jgi:DNA-directed RNA polymerase subunit K/omega
MSVNVPFNTDGVEDAELMAELAELEDIIDRDIGEGDDVEANPDNDEEEFMGDHMVEGSDEDEAEGANIGAATAAAAAAAGPAMSAAPRTARRVRITEPRAPGGGEEESKEQYGDDAGDAAQAPTRRTRQPKTRGLTAEEVLASIRQQAENEEMEDEFDEDVAEEETAEAENTLQKLSQQVRQEYLLTYHNELKQLNYTEITALAKVERDSTGNVIDPLHTTVPFLTKYERARILGVRAKQINSGAEPFIAVDEKIIDGYVIAEMELRAKKIPFIISRPLPDGQIEYWRAADLELLDY